MAHVTHYIGNATSIRLYKCLGQYYIICSEFKSKSKSKSNSFSNGFSTD